MTKKNTNYKNYRNGKRKIFWVLMFFLLLSFSPKNSFGAEGDLIWEKFEDITPSDDQAYGVAVYSTGVYAVGTTDCCFDWTVERRSLTNGSLVWQKILPSSEYGIAYDVAVNSTGVYAAGWYDGIWRVEKRSLADGSLIWERPVDITANHDGAYGIAIGSDGVYVAGSQDDGKIWRVEKRSLADGSLIWEKPIDIVVGEFDEAYGIVVGSDGVYVGGTQNNYSIWRIEKRSLADGSLIWEKAEDITTGDDSLSDLAVDSTGVYAAGGQNCPEIWRVEKRSLTDGSLIWEKADNTAGYSTAFGVDVNPSGLYVVGNKDGLWSVEKRSLENGSLIWARDDTFGSEYNCAMDVSVNSSGIYSAGRQDYFTFWRVEKRKINNNPSVTLLPANVINCDIGNLSVTLSWVYSDLDNNPIGTDPQTAYQIQIDDNSDFSSPIIDYKLDPSSSNQYYTNAISYDTTYYWKVKVWDSSAPVRGESCWDGACPKGVFTTGKQCPSSGFTWSPLNPAVGSTVTFNDTGACYAPPCQCNYVFQNASITAINGVCSTLPTFQNSFISEGNKAVTQNIRDSLNRNVNLTKFVSVGAASLPPTSDPGGPYEIYQPTSQTTLDGSNSTDPEDDPLELEYNWSITNNNANCSPINLTGINSVINCTSVGQSDITLTVTDTSGLSNSQSTTITVNNFNGPPTASISCTPSSCSVFEGQALTFNNDSSDPEGESDIKRSMWCFKKAGEPDFCPSWCDFDSKSSCTPSGISPGEYNIAELYIKDSAVNPDTDTQGFEIKNNISANFNCSLDGSSWQNCELLNLFLPQQVFFQDLSQPSQGAPFINSWLWKKDGVDFDLNDLPTPFLEKVSPGSVINLEVIDDNGQIGSVEHEIGGTLLLPKWKEITPF